MDEAVAVTAVLPPVDCDDHPHDVELLIHNRRTAVALTAKQAPLLP
jgi:hypothetical protein